MSQNTMDTPQGYGNISEEDQKKAGVPPDMVRLSIGLETLDDIVWDIGQALEA